MEHIEMVKLHHSTPTPVDLDSDNNNSDRIVPVPRVEIKCKSLSSFNVGSRQMYRVNSQILSLVENC